ncbi:uncharacterized protein LODBEIA_P26410 [Lodderomyces beijingensis]|uniref:GPI ethanolamine phosphate transferase 2 n=1 Tax=Lodderomyces beijingensis TaxID=1775926 RepID=A0ABP0ZQE3_9ASCO
MLQTLNLKWVGFLILCFSNIAGYLLFLRGFFPSKVVLPGFNTFSQGNSSTSPFLDENGKPHFNKFILMVVDAMRSDFCFGEESGFTFVQDLISQGHAIPFTAFSNPPTVTLPRLKGITTGGTPSFLDAILNVADDYDDSQGMYNQDSWIHQFKLQNKSINFFGDDTWLKLFPDQFTEFEGTNSFFVSDFTEVDLNVTRHLDRQLSEDKGKQDWDGLILHYLGLDHIGHKGGAKSIYMKDKQKEMDAIAKRLYEFIEKNSDTLFILMGDHGMNDVGNHGGSSEGETSAAMVLISPKLKVDSISQSKHHPSSEYSYYHNILQIDLVPMVASLLNFPIPKNSLGVLPREILGQWREEQWSDIMLENCHQIMELYAAKNGHGQGHGPLWEKWQKSINSTQSTDAYYELLAEVQSELASSATEYNYQDIYRGTTIVIISAIAVLVWFTLYFYQFAKLSPAKIAIFPIFTLIYAIHFHGSSLIEEEHQIWTFATYLGCFCMGTSLLKLSEKRRNFALLLALTSSLRVLQSWNLAGQKWLSAYTISGFLSQSNGTLLWFLITSTYLVCAAVTVIQARENDGRVNKLGALGDRIGSMVFFVAISTATLTSYSFKAVQYYVDGGSLPPILNEFVLWIFSNFGIELSLEASATDPHMKFLFQAASIQLSRWASYTLVAAAAFNLLWRRLQNQSQGQSQRGRGNITLVANTLTLFLIHQTRATNIPLFLFCMVAKFSMSKFVTAYYSSNIDQRILVIAASTIVLQNFTFFATGNTNSLATVDLTNAYNGISSYNVISVGVLTFVSNFAGPLFWSLSSLQLIYEPSVTSFEKDSKVDLTNYAGLKNSVLLVKSLVSLFFYSISAVSLMVSCINLRFHLFVWTVFSPKLLYFGSWMVFVNLLTDIIVSTITLCI